jgi:hypothetical protein
MANSGGKLAIRHPQDLFFRESSALRRASDWRLLSNEDVTYPFEIRSSKRGKGISVGE